MEELLENITTYIALYGPIVVSIVGSIATIVTSIKRVKNIQNDASIETRRMQREMVKTQELCNEVLKQNTELKKELSQTLMDKHKIYTREHKRGD